MQEIFRNIAFTINIILPVFLIAAIGYFLKVKAIISDVFVSASSKIVFNVALPVLIFMKISKVDYTRNFQWDQVILVYSVTIGIYLLAWFIGKVFITDGKKLGSFVQGSLRSNIAIVGFAIIFNMSGDEGLAHGAIILSFLMPLYNVLSVIVLSVTTHSGNNVKVVDIIKEILKNPLIISIIIAFLFPYLNIELPLVLNRTGDYLTSLTLPLALLSIGGNLDLTSLRETSTYSLFATIIKLLLIPLIVVLAAVQLGYRGIVLGNLFVITGSPTAIVSYIMAKAMGADDKMAGNIIVISTLGAVLTISIGLFLMKTIGLI